MLRTSLLVASSVVAMMPLVGCRPSFEGYNMHGVVERCTPLGEDVPCTAVVTPDDVFGMECREAGHQAVLCECHHWLCEVPPDELRER